MIASISSRPDRMKYPISLSTHLGAIFAGVALFALPQSKAEDSLARPLPPAQMEKGGIQQAPGHLELPHIQQGRGTNFCGPSVALTAYQRQTGLRLNNQEIVQRLASMVMETAGDPNFGLGVDCLYRPLNMKFTRENFLENSNISDIKIARVLALDFLRKKIIPELQNGSYFGLKVTTGHPLGHQTLITNYDSKNDILTVHDSLLSSVSKISVSDFANKWPYRSPKATYYALNADKLEFPPCAELRDPPQDICVSISAEALGKLKIPEDLTPQMLDSDFHSNRFADKTDWKQLSVFWGNRDPQKVLGVADVARIKVAQGEPPLMVFDKGESVLKVVAVSGYRGGYCNPKGEIQLTMLHEDKLESKWLSVSDFLLKCSPRQGNGQYGCYIGYPQTSLRDPKQPLASIATDRASPRPAPDFFIEAETLLANTVTTGGRVIRQSLPKREVSGKSVLTWQDGRPADQMTLNLSTSQVLKPGNYDLALSPATWVNCGRVKIRIGSDEKTVDLYSNSGHVVGEPIFFRKVEVSPDSPLQITVQIVDKGSNPKPVFNVGIDRLEFTKIP